MNPLRRLFGSNKDEVWRELCKEVGADFVDGGFWKGNKVVARVNPWTLTLDKHTVSTGQSHVPYTRLRAPFINKDGFHFTIYRQGFFSPLEKLLGIQDIEVGYTEFR